jgi:hypothetical protein
MTRPPEAMNEPEFEQLYRIAITFTNLLHSAGQIVGIVAGVLALLIGRAEGWKSLPKQYGNWNLATRGWRPKFRGRS